MTPLKIIIGLGIVSGLLFLYRTKSTFLKIVFLVLTACLILGYFTELPVKSEVFVTFGITVLLFSAWSAFKHRWIELVIGTCAFVSFIWIFFNFANYNMAQFLMILPLLGYLWTLIKWKDYRPVLSVLTILAAYELSELIRFALT